MDFISRCLKVGQSEGTVCGGSTKGFLDVFQSVSLAHEQKLGALKGYPTHPPSLGESP